MDAVPVFDRADCPLWWLRAFLPTNKALMRNPSIRPWLVLRAIEGVGDATLLKLLDIFGNPDAVLRASEDDLIHGGCVSSRWRERYDEASPPKPIVGLTRSCERSSDWVRALFHISTSGTLRVYE